MGMFAFWEMFPDVARVETRTVTVPKGQRLPAGLYAFREQFCVEPHCECRRVMIQVESEREQRPVATINHAFDPENAEPVLGRTFLDPLHPQSEIADELLRLFLAVMASDPTYVARLERHYELVKRALRDPSHPVHAKIPRHDDLTPLTWPTQRRRSGPKIGRNDPCPCGSGRKFKRCRCGLAAQ